MVPCTMLNMASLANTAFNSSTSMNDFACNSQGRLGGGEGVEGIYGSITLAGMRRIYDCMKHNCGFDSSSTLVDVGAGLGRCAWQKGYGDA